MKTGIKLLTSCALLLCLTGCGGDEEEVIVYEESPFEIPATYTLTSGDTAPAYYSNVLAYTATNAVVTTDEIQNIEIAALGDAYVPEVVDPDEVALEPTKAELKAAEEELARLQAAAAILQVERDKEFNQLNSIRVVSLQDPTEVNNLAIEDAKIAYLESFGLNEDGEPAKLTIEEGEDMSFLDEVELLPYIYTYDVSTLDSSGGEITADYVSYMQKSGFKIVDVFHPVNKEYYEMLDPDFTQRAGTVAMAKKASGTNKLVIVIVDWNSVGAVVTVYEEEGTLWVAPKVDTAAKGALSIADGVNYFKQMNPSSLGLTGNSMEEYSVYSQEGILMVNGVNYRQFTISKNNASGSGMTFGGTYLMDADGNTFSFNRVTGVMVPLDAPNVYDTIK